MTWVVCPGGHPARWFLRCKLQVFFNVFHMFSWQVGSTHVQLLVVLRIVSDISSSRWFITVMVLQPDNGTSWTRESEICCLNSLIYWQYWHLSIARVELWFPQCPSVHLVTPCCAGFARRIWDRPCRHVTSSSGPCSTFLGITGY